MARKKKISFEEKFRREFQIDEGVKSEDFLTALNKAVRKEPLMVTLVWSTSGLVLRTTADMENSQSVQQLSTNLRSVAEQLTSLAFDLVSKENRNDSESIPEPIVGEDKQDSSVEDVLD